MPTINQFVNVLTGTAGEIISLTGVSDPTNYAVTIRNRATTGATPGRALQILKSDGTNLMSFADSGVILAFGNGTYQAPSIVPGSNSTIGLYKVLDQTALGLAPKVVINDQGSGMIDVATGGAMLSIDTVAGAGQRAMGIGMYFETPTSGAEGQFHYGYYVESDQKANAASLYNTHNIHSSIQTRNLRYRETAGLYVNNYVSGGSAGAPVPGPSAFGVDIVMNWPAGALKTDGVGIETIFQMAGTDDANRVLTGWRAVSQTAKTDELIHPYTSGGGTWDKLFNFNDIIPTTAVVWMPNYAFTVQSIGIQSIGGPHTRRNDVPGSGTYDIWDHVNAANSLVLCALTVDSSGNYTIGSVASKTWAIQTGGTARVTIDTAGDVKFSQALIALGGGAAPTLGTIGGSGPAAAAQNTWKKFIDSTGAAFFVPVWK